MEDHCHPLHVRRASSWSPPPVLGENVESRGALGHAVLAVVAHHRVLTRALEIHAATVEADTVRVAPAPTDTHLCADK